MKPTLIIMAAGMASRYGSLKQIEKLGPQGQTIMDYSVHDAIEAGFGKILFIIRKSIEKEFTENIISKYKDKIDVDYVFQEVESLPEGIPYSSERTKPWGTGHAVLMAAEKIKTPFAVINSDDFYGRNAFIAAMNHINKGDPETYGIIGYPINKTLSDHGAITRAICETDENNYLEDITERTHIQAIDNNTFYKDEFEIWQAIDNNATVSMNFWVFYPSFFQHLKIEFDEFIQANSFNLKAEILIPTVIKSLIKESQVRVRVYNVDSQWFGVTYPEDREGVVLKLSELTGYN